MPERVLSLTDPRALRALAHPVRLALLGELRRRGAMTATAAAPRVGESVASCSFHLRQLAKYGLVEPAPRKGGRDRPWQATAEFTSFPMAPADPDLAAAAGAFVGALVRRYAEVMQKAVDGHAAEPPEWREAALIGDSLLYLTAGELAELQREVVALARRHADRMADPSRRPPGSRLVTFIHWAVPEPLA